MRSPEGSTNNGQNKSPATTKLRGRGRGLAVAATAALAMLVSACSDSSTASGNIPPTSDIPSTSSNMPSEGINSNSREYSGLPGESPSKWVYTENNDHCIITPAHILRKTKSEYFTVEDVRGDDRGTLCNIKDLIESNQLPDGFAQAIDKSAEDYEEILDQVPETITDGEEEAIATVLKEGWAISIGEFINPNKDLRYRLNDGSAIGGVENEWGPNSCSTERGDRLRSVGQVAINDFTGKVVVYLEGQPGGNGAHCHYGEILIVPNVEDVNPTASTSTVLPSRL